MKKLLLTSSFKYVADELLKIISKPANQMTVAFVPTAADPYDEKPWMEVDKQLLEDQGFKIMVLPLKDQTKQKIESALKNVDIVFVEGGNAFYLLDNARKSGFTELIPKFVEQGLIYVGSSAGSYIAGKSIETGNWKKNKNFIKLNDLSGMGIVPFTMFAHYKPEHSEMLKEKVKLSKFPVKILKDNQAILAVEDTYTLVGDPEEIKL